MDEELGSNLTINTILEQGKFNDHMMSRYFQYIKNNDEFDKLLFSLLGKYDYKILKIGSGNYLVN